MSSTLLTVLGALAVVLSTGLLAGVIVRTWLRWRGPRVITCPETHRPAAVDVDVALVVSSGLLGAPTLRLADCSRWPEKAGCAQACLSQVEASPEECLVRRILGRFYEGRSCVRCGQAFGVIHWHDHKPAVRGTDGVTRAWSEIAPADVPDTLAQGQPVCWNCHEALAFRREHPELVVERRYPGART